MAHFITFKPFIPRITTIINPTEQTHKPLCLDVPITSNHHNRKRFVSDWELRTWYEFTYSKTCAFITLTFDEQHVPRFSDGRLGFCPDYVTLFFKRFRNRMDRRYGINIKEHFRYFLCSEYGKNTNRPHHHALFFFDEFVPITTIQECVSHSWYYGFVDVELPDSNRVLTYVSKYVAKDMFSMDIQQSKDDDELNETRSIYNFSTSSYDEYKFTRYNFHRQSLGYGSQLLNDITEEDLNQGVKFVFMGGAIARPFAIPKYVSDKLLRYRERFVDKDGKKRSKTFDTDLGKRVHVERVKRRVDSIIEDLEKYQNQCFVYLDLYGIDIDLEQVSLASAYRKNYHHTSVDLKEDLFDYLLNKRYRAIDFRDNIPLLKSEKRDTPQWNAQYSGYEDLLLYIQDIEYIVGCHQQRADEIQEFKNLIKKRRYGRAY